jgi:CRP-like cAMP-binding protein
MPEADVASSPQKSENLFKFSASDLKELEKHGSKKTFAKGDPIWNQGDDPEAVWMIKSGRVNMVIESAEGTESIVHFCTQADTFCPAAAITGLAYPCNAVAATDIEAVAVPRSRFMSMFNGLPKFAKSLLSQMAPQVCDAHCSQALSASPVASRLAAVISQLNQKFGGKRLNFTRQELANMSGTTVETTIRTLSEWEKKGMIQSERGSLTVKQPLMLEMAMA